VCVCVCVNPCGHSGVPLCVCAPIHGRLSAHVRLLSVAGWCAAYWGAYGLHIPGCQRRVCWLNTSGRGLVAGEQKWRQPNNRQPNNRQQLLRLVGVPTPVCYIDLHVRGGAVCAVSYISMLTNGQLWPQSGLCGELSLQKERCKGPSEILISIKLAWEHERVSMHKFLWHIPSRLWELLMLHKVKPQVCRMH